MPITSTVVAPNVCIDPTRSFSPRRYYPLEKDRKIEQCTYDDEVDAMNDPRYTMMDLSITEL